MCVEQWQHQVSWFYLVLRNPQAAQWLVDGIVNPTIAPGTTTSSEELT